LKQLVKIILNLVPRSYLISISLRLLPFLKLIFRGNRFIDPIDNSHLSRFLPYGYENIRKNALSPTTLSLERHRLLWLYLKNETNIFTDSVKLLHIAPEQAYYKRLKNRDNIDYTSLDLHSPIADINADIKNMPFKDETFDIIICNHVLEHIKDDDLAIQAIYYSLKKGGFAILQIPLNQNLQKTFEDDSIVDPELRKKHFGQYDHVRIYGWDFFEKLNNIGFESHAIAYANRFNVEEQKMYGLENDDLIPFAKKY